MIKNKSINFTVTSSLLCIFLIKTSFYNILPFLAVFINGKINNYILSGSILIFYTVFAKAFPMLGRFISLKIGKKKTISISLLLLSILFILILFANHFYQYSVIVSLIGLSYSFIEPNLQGTIAEQNEITKKNYFNNYYMSVNLGAALGPLMGGVVFSINESLIFIISSSVSILSFFVIILWYVDEAECFSKVKITLSSFLHAIKLNFRQGYYLLSFNNIGYWIVYAQFYVLLPLYASSVFGNPKLISILFAVNAAMIIILQIPVSRLISRIGYIDPLIFGHIFILAGCLIFYMFSSIAGLFLGVIMFTFSEIFYLPEIMNNISRHSAKNAQDKTMFISLSLTIFAIGESCGNFLSGWTFQHFNGSSAVWSFFASISVLNLALYLLYKFRFSHYHASE